MGATFTKACSNGILNRRPQHVAGCYLVNLRGVNSRINTTNPTLAGFQPTVTYKTYICLLLAVAKRTIQPSPNCVHQQQPVQAPINFQNCFSHLQSHTKLQLLHDVPVKQMQLSLDAFSSQKFQWQMTV